MIRRALLLMAVGVTASAISVVACSDNSRPGPSGASGGIYGSTSSGGASSGSSSSSGGEGGTDGSTEGGTGLCDGPKQLGEPVVETRLVGDPPPALGGVIPDGTYILSSRNSYGAAPNTEEDGGPGDSGAGSTDVKRATMVILGASMKISSSKGPSGALPADVAAGFSFTISGTTINATPVCPAGPAMTIPFSAVGTGVALFIDPTHREVYVRQ